MALWPGLYALRAQLFHNCLASRQTHGSNPWAYFKEMALWPGFEPGTYALEVRCSIQLSYQSALERNGIYSGFRQEASHLGEDVGKV